MPNHPNRSPSAHNAARNPKGSEVIAARQALMDRHNREHPDKPIGITDAQTKCASFLHTTLRTWQQWETEDRRMHPAFWDLFQIRAKGKA